MYTLWLRYDLWWFLKSSSIIFVIDGIIVVVIRRWIVFDVINTLGTFSRFAPSCNQKEYVTVTRIFFLNFVLKFFEHAPFSSVPANLVRFINMAKNMLRR